MEDEQKKELIKILGLSDGTNYQAKISSWSEIFVEIGKLQEKASRKEQEILFTNPSVPTEHIPTDTQLFHYHGLTKCFRNPCFSC